MKFYVTRHGKTIWNEEGRIQGFLNSSLTEEGVQRAIELSSRTKNLDIGCIVTSDLKRAKDTSYYIKGGSDFPIFYFSEFREMSFGDWEGQKFTDISEKYPEQYNNFEKNPLAYDNGSGETFAQLIERVNIGINKSKKLGYETVMIVTHGITVKAIQTILENRKLEDINKLPVIAGCSLIGYEVYKEKVTKFLSDDDFDFIPKTDL